MKIKCVDWSEIKTGDIFSAFAGTATVELMKLAGREQDQFFLEIFDRTKEKFIPWKKVSMSGKFIVISD